MITPPIRWSQNDTNEIVMLQTRYVTNPLYRKVPIFPNLRPHTRPPAGAQVRPCKEISGFF
jgi:hypothetical protein